MHVVHLYDGHEKVYRGRGSVPNVVWNVARETAAAGHEVTVLERQWQGLERRSVHEGVQFRRLDLRTGADEPWTRVPYEQATSLTGLLRLIGDRTNFALSALRWLRKEDFDILHVHLPFAANVLTAVAPSLCDRTVYTAHLGELRLNALSDGQGDDPTSSSEESEKEAVEVPGVLQAWSPDVHLAKRAAHTTVLNPQIRDVFEARGVPNSSLSMVPNGVDIDRFSDVDPHLLAKVRESYELQDTFVLLFVGTVMPRKGVEHLIRAMDELVNERAVGEVQLLVVGEDELDGEYTTTVRQLVRDTGLTDHVTFTGFVPDEELPALYALADVFVMPSVEEGFGMTVTEAMAAATPVVGTRVGGIPQQITDGTNGLLVDPADDIGLADALAWLFERPGEREAFGSAARQRAREFSWREVSRGFITVYEEVVKRV